MNLKEVKALETRIAKLVEEVRNAVVEDVRNTPMEGVKPVSASPRACVVKLSTIMSHRCIMSPEYYIQESQAALVEQKLANLTTATALTNAIHEMIANKSVKIGSDRHPLNDSTITVLQRFAEE